MLASSPSYLTLGSNPEAQGPWLCSSSISTWRLRCQDISLIHHLPYTPTPIPPGEESHQLLEGVEQGEARQTQHRDGVFGGSDGKESACKAEDSGLIPGSERSPGEGNGYPLQYSCEYYCPILALF